ncbi:MAG: leucine--tRNA ligase [Candidatus Xiphinematobacter sp.]|nr:MAG: leucine--tRNA ligase [Candidatus Xiphinematobacter sp.]
MTFSKNTKKIPFDEYESRWQLSWLRSNSFSVPNPGEPGFDPRRPKFYLLDMFPYPSGEGLHVGHVEGYTATDILARYKRMCGFQVLHPMGWDAFGLPTEQFALKTNQHPAVTTEKNINRFRAQLQSLGLSYDWKREINTTNPAYFRWTQWIFLQIYNSWVNPSTGRAEAISTCRRSDPDSVRLAYVAEIPVNWCPSLGTVLAKEEVRGGYSEVGGFPVERRPMRQWILRITAYAQRLIDDLEDLDWPESVKLLQRNWIGRSEGVEVTFRVVSHTSSLRVFTTRPDTLFGVTYLVIAPEHPMSSTLTVSHRKSEVEAYLKLVSSKSDLERTDLNKDKTGVFTGSHAINPINGEKIPIWISDYVLMSYGTGAVMAVPAHDKRDFEFARKFHLPIHRVIASRGSVGDCFPGESIAIHSPLIEGLPTEKARERITVWLEKQGMGRPVVHYKLRDWLFSRQRYWGEPFPIIWEGGRHHALDPSELPICQPAVTNFKPSKTGEPPLAQAIEWVRYSEKARRETNTMPQWAGSCWYYLRFCDPHNSSHFVGAEAERYWMESGRRAGGVDLYVGGTEHAVLHLLYARFWHKVLFDLGHVSTPEPFQRLINQGMILGSDGQKMSKSRGNVINPESVVAEYGADSLRLYEMFMGPLEQTKPWNIKGVEGVYRFLARVWRLAFEEDQEGCWRISSALTTQPCTPHQLRIIHATIKKVTADIEAFSFNTAIAQLMAFVNEFTSVNPCPVEVIQTLLQLLSPFAPHLAEEVWFRLASRFSCFTSNVSNQPWPKYEESLLVEIEKELVVQINGKTKDRVRVSGSVSSAEVELIIMALPKIRAALGKKTPVRFISVPGLVNLVVH